jgi:hypothetical protein
LSEKHPFGKAASMGVSNFLAYKKTDKPKLFATLRGAMKKRLTLLFTLAGLAWLAALGCSNKNIDTAKVREAFQSLSGEAKDDLEQGLQAIDQSNYVAAVKPLNKVGYLAKLGKEQRLLLQDTIAQAEAKAAKQK